MENMTKTEQAAAQKSKTCGGTGSAKRAALSTKGAACCKSSTRLQTARRLTQTKPTSGSKTTAPATVRSMTACQSATLRPKTLSIALSRNQDISVTREKHSCTAEKTASKPQLSREHGKTSKTGSVTKRNNRPPEKAGVCFERRI